MILANKQTLEKDSLVALSTHDNSLISLLLL